MEAGFTITKQGWHLLAKLLAGDKLEISKIMVGSGKVPEGVNPGEITELVRPVALATSTVPQVADKQVSFIVEYRNDLNGGLAEGFWLNEFGVYANDPDNGEILLYYATMGNYPQYVAAYNGQAVDVRRYPVVIALSECYNVELKPPAGAWVTFEELAETLKRRGYHSNPNLLINGDFRKPVNRNGKREYTGAGYTIDRWHLENNTLSLLTDCIQTSGTFKQVLQPKDIQVGKQYTFSVLVKEITGTALFTVYDGQQKSLSEGLNVLTFIATTNTYQGIYAAISITQNVKIIAAKLELGSVQTLAHKDENGNWVLNGPPNYDLQYVLCNQYSPITGEFVGSQHSNPNLLDNAYWADKDYIINQRGQNEYTGTGYAGYTIDRWLLSGMGKVQITSQGIILQKTGDWLNFKQILPSKIFNSKNYDLQITFSALISGNIRPVIVYNTNSNMSGNVHSSENISLMQFTTTLNSNMLSSDLKFILQAVDDNPNTVVATKLELGQVQTLAHKDENGNWILNDPPPNKALELAKCQRYFISFGQYTIIYKSTLGDLTLDVPVPMRTFPAIVKQASNFTFTVAWVNQTQLLLRVPEGETAPTGDAMLASSLWLSAEL